MRTRAQQLALMTAARRAPSAHNTQPARFRFDPDGTIHVLEDITRRLHVGDPHGRDAMIGIGAALEALHLALGGQELGIGHVELTRANIAGSLREVASAKATARASDPLAPQLERRRSYRGVFAPATDEVKAFRDVAIAAGDVRVLTDRADIDHTAELIDSCSLEFMRDANYRTELWEWMRLTPRHPQWDRDGLNADCLALSRAERAAGRILMRPAVFGALARLGVAGPLVAESRQVRSATAVVLLHRPMEEDPFVTGRRFLRMWLELTQAGLSACPMSAITDSPSGNDEMRRRYGVPGDRRLVNAFRVGVAPTVPASSARLPAEELLV